MEHEDPDNLFDVEQLAQLLQRSTSSVSVWSKEEYSLFPRVYCRGRVSYGGKKGPLRALFHLKDIKKYIDNRKGDRRLLVTQNRLEEIKKIINAKTLAEQERKKENITERLKIELKNRSCADNKFWTPMGLWTPEHELEIAIIRIIVGQITCRELKSQMMLAAVFGFMNWPDVLAYVYAHWMGIRSIEKDIEPYMDLGDKAGFGVYAYYTGAKILPDKSEIALLGCGILVPLHIPTTKKLLIPYIQLCIFRGKTDYNSPGYDESSPREKKLYLSRLNKNKLIKHLRSNLRREVGDPAKELYFTNHFYSREIKQMIAMLKCAKRIDDDTILVKV